MEVEDQALAATRGHDGQGRAAGSEVLERLGLGAMEGAVADEGAAQLVVELGGRHLAPARARLLQARGLLRGALPVRGEVEAVSAHDDVHAARTVCDARVPHSQRAGQAQLAVFCRAAAGEGRDGGGVALARVHHRGQARGQGAVEVAQLGAVQQLHRDGVAVELVVWLAHQLQLDAGLQARQGVLAVLEGDAHHLGVEARHLGDAGVVALVAYLDAAGEELVEEVALLRVSPATVVHDHALGHELGGEAALPLVYRGLEEHVAGCLAGKHGLHVLDAEPDAGHAVCTVCCLEAQVVARLAHGAAVVEEDVARHEHGRGVGVAKGLQALELLEAVDVAFCQRDGGVCSERGLDALLEQGRCRRTEAFLQQGELVCRQGEAHGRRMPAKLREQLAA